MFFAKIRQNKLEWSQVMRSNDVLLGMPYNFIQFTGLQEILAGWLDLDLGTYNHYSDSLHLYSRDMSKVGVSEGTVLENNDSLALCKEETEKLFKEIYRRMDFLSTHDVTENEIYSLGQLNSEYVPYNNMMLIIAAYVAKKQHLDELVAELIKKCSNTVYVTMWNRWVNRKNMNKG